ncbi:MAG TPA: hypothetical protein VFH31_19580 [Pyrinomonadaceae bacterium]|nr:hypothetical protein [Pyrinomonadaceae bacterium]
MTALTYPPATSFVIPDDHPNRKAHQWLASQLDGLDWGSEVDYWWFDRQGESLLAKLNEQPRTFQIAVLKACVERMPWHRRQPSSEDCLSTHYYIGSLLYNMAYALYQRKLPYSEEDICQILRLSRHTCGHGSDVTPPFDIAVDYARANGVTVELFSALKDFVNGLKGVRSSKVTHLKRKGGLLFVLDSESTGTRKSCWSDRFRTDLLTLAPKEQPKWRQLVLNMTVNDVYVLPKVWRHEATKFVQDLGPPLVVERLSTWWPDPKVKIIWPIQTGGSHLLKYFVWLLSVAGAMSELEPKCIELVCRLSELDWKPRERAQKVMIAAASYLRSFPPEVSWPALQRLAQWSALAPGATKGNKIREVLRTYCQDHKLDLPELVEEGEKTERTDG